MNSIYILFKSIGYTFATFFATVLGSFTGMGGGILIKPIFDIIGHFPTKTINEMTTITIFCTTLIGIVRHIIKKTPVQYTIMVPIALGAALGGVFGQLGFDILLANIPEAFVLVIQNFGLCIVIIFSYIFMRDREHIEFLELRNPRISFEAGLILGLVSCFLGIGGGPLNIAFLLYLFNYPVRMALVGSTMIMLFSQTAKLITISLSENSFTLLFIPNSNQVLPVYITFAMVLGAVVGGIVGGSLNKKVYDNNDLVEYDRITAFWFNVVQAIVLIIAIYNIVSNLI